MHERVRDANISSFDGIVLCLFRFVFLYLVSYSLILVDKISQSVPGRGRPRRNFDTMFGVRNV